MLVLILLFCERGMDLVEYDIKTRVIKPTCNAQPSYANFIIAVSANLVLALFRCATFCAVQLAFC